MAALVTISSFSGLAPPWSLTQLDTDLTNLRDAIQSQNTFSNFAVDTGAANAYVTTPTAGITATLTAGLLLQFKATNANTGASTLNHAGLGVKNILNQDGSALFAGQILSTAITVVQYDGTQFVLLSSTPKITLGTEQLSTAGTSIDFTVPAGVKKVTIMYVGVSTSSTSSWIVQIGPSGGPETSGYLGGSSIMGAAVASTLFTTGFAIATNANGNTSVFHGSTVLNLENSTSNTWTMMGTIARSDLAGTAVSAGSKSIAGVLNKVRITTAGGVDTFDAGAINIQYE